jgi:subtilase family serine protease
MVSAPGAADPGASGRVVPPDPGTTIPRVTRKKGPTPMARSASPSRWAVRTGVAAVSAAALVSGVFAFAQAQAATTPSGSASVQVARSCAQSTTPHVMSCFALRRTDIVGTLAIGPNATPSGLGPANLQNAYKLSTAGGGSATVAIVDAFDDPKAESDLASYRSQFGLPACTTANGCFRKVNQNGAASPLPPSDTGWAGEISLDVDMVSAVCPNCRILLVESNDNSNASLYAAEDRAVAMGAKFVSNSWGGDESSTQTSDDVHFNHPGVAITVSSGDNGNGAEYPATSRFVTAVGGTSLRTASNARGWTESAWNGAGSGCSAFDAKATWQNVTTNCPRRADADVSAVADPATGVAVFDSFGAPGWQVFGGTSASAPIVASVYALAGTPGASDFPASYPYAHPGNLFDVTTGSNGGCGAPQCNAGTGWDGPTGLGTPNGTAAFTAGGGGGGNTVTVTNPGSRTGTVGTATSLQIQASDSSPAATLSYAASGLPTGLSINAGSGLISGTPTAAGTFNVTVTVTDNTGASGSASFTWTISPTGGGCASPGQKLGNPGFETGTAAPWTATPAVIDSTAAQPAHSGTWKAWLDGYGTTHTDSLSQTVSLPAGCSSYTFTFFLHIDSAEKTASTQFDKLTVKAGNTTLATFSNLNKATGYSQKSFNLAAFAGQSVTITFTGTEDSSLQTSFVVDDTALTVA